MKTDELLHSSAEQLLNKLPGDQSKKQLTEKVVGVVKKHCKLAAGTGLIPVPGADLVLGTSNTAKMFDNINKELGLKAKKLSIKGILPSLMSSLMARLTTAGVSNAMKLIPGVGQVTGALVSSVTQYVMALSMGYLYFNALTQITDDKGNVSFDKLSDTLKQLMVKGAGVAPMIDAIKSNTTQLFGLVKDNVSAWAGTAADGIGSAATTVTKGASDFYGMASKGISSAASSVADVAGSAAVNVKSGASSVIGKAGKGLSSLGKSVGGLWNKKKEDK